MRLVRMVMALMIALSLAMLPTAGLAVSVPDLKSQPATEGMAKEMAMASELSGAMDECCPDHMKSAPSHTAGYKCNMGLCCAGGSLARGDVAPIGFVFLSASASKVAIPADQIVSVRGSSPPFRPPRV